MANLFSSDDSKISQSMKIALGVSVAFHVGVVILGVVGLPIFSKPPTLLSSPVAVEIIDVAELTTMDKPPVVSLKEPEPKDSEKESPKVEKQVKAPPKVDVKEPPKIKPITKPPEPKKETVKPKSETPPPPVAELEKPKEPEPPKPKKEDETKEEAVEQEDPLLSLMKNLQESEDSSEADKPEDVAAENAPDAPQAQFVTANELSALSNQLIGCWQIPIGAKDVNDMVVSLRIWVNADRTVRRVESEDKLRKVSDPAFRALAESAERAVRDPRCSPLLLPEDKYEVWRDQYILVPFDPSQVT